VKIDVGLFELLGARISVAFVDASSVESGDDQLLAAIWERLQHKTTWPLMLYSADGRGYAPFQAHEFSKRIRREHANEIIEIDLTKPFYEYQDEPAF
jgi:hypothetical protein